MICKLGEPFTGDILVEQCDAIIRSIELQLVRVETCGCAEGYAKDGMCVRSTYSRVLIIMLLYLATEIQNIQIGDGDISRNVPIPIYMIFPRLFTCPTLITTNFKIGKHEVYSSRQINIILSSNLEFEVNVVVIFEDNHLITENFPIKLVRS